MMRPEQLMEYQALLHRVEMQDALHSEDLDALLFAFDHILTYTEHRENQRARRARWLRELRRKKNPDVSARA